MTRQCLRMIFIAFLLVGNIPGQELNTEETINDKDKKQEKYFSQAGTLEYTGSVSALFDAQDLLRDDCCDYSINLFLGLDTAYYLVDSIHINLGFNFAFDKRQFIGRDFSGARFFPIIGLGYTFPVSNDLFFDMEFDIGHAIPIDALNEGITKTSTALLISTDFAFKFALDRALINVFLNYGIEMNVAQDRYRGSIFHLLRLGIGYSLYSLLSID